MLNDHASEPSILRTAPEVIRPLRDCFLQMIRSLPEAGPAGNRPHIPGIHPTLQSRLGRALEADDVALSLYHMPGAAGLRQAIKAARRAGANAGLAEACLNHIDRYERFLEDEGIGRDALHAVLGGFVPEAREASIRASTQSAFRAMSNLIGYYAEVFLATAIFVPGTEPQRHTMALLRGCAGWRRLHHDSPLGIHTIDIKGAAAAKSKPPHDLEGRLIHELPGPPLLQEFCQGAPVVFDTFETDSRRVYRLISTEVGARSECSFFMNEVHHNSEPAFSTPDQRNLWCISAPATPAKRLLLDVLLHKSVWPDVVPHAETFRLVPWGPVGEGDWERRQFDRMDLGMTIRPLRASLAAVGATSVPRYRDIVAYAMERLGFSVEDFRIFRSEVTYPLWGLQYSMRWKLPPAPKA